MSEMQAELVAKVAESLKVLRRRDGQGPSDDQCEERARNIVAWLSVDYAVIPMKSFIRSMAKFRTAQAIIQDAAEVARHIENEYYGEADHV